MTLDLTVGCCVSGQQWCINRCLVQGPTGSTANCLCEFEMPPLREDLSKTWHEPSLRRRRCSSVLQVDPSLAQQHHEEPRRPCSFSAHQQFTIRAATTTNSALSKREDASVHQLIDSRLSQLQLFKNRLKLDLDERPDKGWWTYWIDISCCTGSLRQSIYRIPLLFIKWSKSWLNLLR